MDEKEPRHHFSFHGMVLLSLLGTLPIGCGRNSRLPTYQVTGKVVFPDGTPLKGGSIILESRDHPLAARGLINEDGIIHALATYEQSDGAIAGKQQVAIIPAVPPNHDPDLHTTPPSVDPRFTHMDSSGLQVEVRPDGENYFEIEVERSGRGSSDKPGR